MRSIKTSNNCVKCMSIPPVKALIPVRKHSKRVENKNTKLFCGKPLFHWILESLSNSKTIAEIVLDTDSEEIEQYAREHFKVTVLKRPERLCGYDVGIHPLIDFHISNTEGEYFMQTHATNPLLTPETVDGAVTAFFDQNQHDSLFSVTRLQTRLYYHDGRPLNHDPENMLRTQDLEPIYEENSNLYIFSRTTFYEVNHRIGRKPLMYPMNHLESIDIDEPHDFQLAETLMSIRLKQV